MHDRLPDADEPRGDDATRRHLLVALFRGVAATTLLGSLAGCGGGGGGDPPAPAPEPPGPPAAPSPSPICAIAAQTTVPTPVGYDADRLAAFDRLNELRRAAGLGLLAQSASLDRAAQAHAEWIVANDSFTHEETAGTAGFTGTQWWLRAEASGYVPVEGSEGIVGGVHGARGIDVLVNGVYHRAGLLAFEPVDVGIGWAAGAGASVAMPLVVDITSPATDAMRGQGQSAQPRIDGVSTWPADGATGVPLRLGQEFPNPVPSQDVLTLGTPASIGVDELTTLSVDSFVMSDAATGVSVPCQLVTSASDPNLLLRQSFVALVPKSSLTPGTRYRVDFAGGGTGVLTGARRAIARSWSFTTGTT